MLCFNIRFNQLPRHSGCYVVTSISINCQDALDATLYQPCEATLKTLWVLRCNIRFNQFSGLLGSWDAMLQHPNSIKFPNAKDATLLHPSSGNSKTLWMLRCISHVKQLPRCCGCNVGRSIWINFQYALDATL